MRDKWHTLLENYVVSSRHLLVQEAVHLLVNDTLKDTVFNWKVIIVLLLAASLGNLSVWFPTRLGTSHPVQLQNARKL